jgi:hypothetical protein
MKTDAGVATSRELPLTCSNSKKKPEHGRETALLRTLAPLFKTTAAMHRKLTCHPRQYFCYRAVTRRRKRPLEIVLSRETKFHITYIPQIWRVDLNTTNAERLHFYKTSICVQLNFCTKYVHKMGSVCL